MIQLGDRPLEVRDVLAVARAGAKLSLSARAIEKIRSSHQFLRHEIAQGHIHYGVNTGFGFLSNVKIAEKDLETLQYNILNSHATGVGELLPDDAVRAMFLLRIADLARGYSGVSLELLEHMIAVLNSGICPCVPCQGSVGASGDLAPLAHLALVLIGSGHARFNGRAMTGSEALTAARLEPIRLGPKEGLSLINGTQMMAALACLNLADAEHLCDVADAAGSMTVEALRGTTVAFEAVIQELKPHPGQLVSAARIRRFLLQDGKSEITQSHEGCGKVQDPYSLRCMPQVHGAARDTLKFVRDIVAREINSVTDNPLVFAEQGRILSGGNFHGEALAMAMDFLAIAAAELASISGERISKLVNPALSDLPAFLVKQSGLNSGFMIVQVAAASIISENKTLCHPASVDSIPTSADKEDHVSMGAWAARKAVKVIENSRRVLAMELMAAAQGVDLLRPLHTTPVLEEIHSLIREKVQKLDNDRIFYQDIESITEMIRTKVFEATIL